MALLKSFIDGAGVTTNYHKINQVTVNNNKVLCIMSSYISKECRDLNYSEVNNRTFQFDITVEEEESMGIRQLCYKKIKELEQWADAEDC